MTITSVAPTIGPTGISAPAFPDILAFVQAMYQAIYGADVYLGPDSQDGQFVAMIAQGFTDVNAAIVQVYNSFSPATAIGAALSSNVKINGISRDVAGYSTVDLLIIGQSNTTIKNGVAIDTQNNRWNLPATVVIPSGGSITVTATCQTLGAITAAEGAVNTIATPTLGWQSVTNAAAATPGNPVETDAQLRTRQTASTALPSQTVLDGIVGGIESLAGVTRVAAHENDTGSTDADGVPAHSLSLVVEGGDAVAIATEIALKKTPGTPTYGTTSESVSDPYGDAQTINFFRPTDTAITVAISMKALTGYNSTIGTTVQQAVADYVNAVAIGGGPSGSVEWDSAIAAAKGVPSGNTFKITSLTLSGSMPAPTNGALTATAGGALAASTYYVRSTWVDASGETLPATETSLAVAANNVLNVAAPGSAPSRATGWNVYVSTAAGTETKQNSSPIALGTAWVEPTSGLISGAALPTANSAAAGNPDVSLAFNEAATCQASDVTLTVT